MQNYLCENLKSLRKQHKLIQEQLARLLGLNRSTYAHHEKCGVPHKYMALYSNILLKEFGFKVSELIEEEKLNDKSNNLIESIELIEQGLRQIKNILKSQI